MSDEVVNELALLANKLLTKEARRHTANVQRLLPHVADEKTASDVLASAVLLLATTGELLLPSIVDEELPSLPGVPVDDQRLLVLFQRLPAALVDVGSELGGLRGTIANLSMASLAALICGHIAAELASYMLVRAVNPNMPTANVEDAHNA